MDNFEMESSSFLAALPKHSFVFNLIYQLEAMSKKPQIDEELSEVLDSLIRKIQNSNKYLDNGIFNINFAEVALLLQSSVQVYGKKVDVLWDRVLDYQSQIISLERESAKREQAENLVRERQLRYKRKRKLEETTKEQANVNELLQLCSNIENANITPCGNLARMWTYAQMKDTNYYNDIEPDDDCFRGSKYTITSAVHSDCENAMNFHKMKLNNSVFELSQEYPVFVGKCLEKNPLNVVHFYESDEVLQDYLVKERISYIEMEKLYRDKYKHYFSEYLTKKSTNTSPDKYNAICPKRLMTHVKRLSEDVLQQYLEKDPALTSAKIKRASSTVPSLPENSVYNDSGYCDYPPETNSLCNITSSSTNNAEHTDCDSYLTEQQIQEEANDSCYASISTDTLNITEPEKIEEHREYNKQTMNRGSIITRSLSENAAKRKRICQEEAEEFPKTKRSKIVHVRQKIRLTAALDVFEEFVLEHYRPEKGEACLEKEKQREIDVGTSPSKDTFVQLQRESEAGDEESLHTDWNIENNDHTDPEDSTANVTEGGEILKRTASPVLHQNSSVVNENILRRIEEERKEREKVEEWRNFITEKLEKSHQKSDFDIHYYGGQIMDKISETENKKFNDVVSGKNASEVSKYFLAVLQLACTENVQIINPSAGCIANNFVELKLLSRECYHENLANYMAPSEESFGKRLAKARSLSNRR